MHKTIMLSLLIITQAFGQTLDAIYKEGLNAAQSNMQKPIDTLNNLNPAEAFKDSSGKSYYTDKPEQIRHYQGVTQGNMDLLDDAGRTRIDENEATKEVWHSFGKPKITLDPGGKDREWLSKSNAIIKNATAITKGTSSQPDEVVKNGASAGINCKEAKVCRIELIKKTCNEEVNHPLRKVCEKAPNISVVDQSYQENQNYSGSITRRDNNSGSFIVPVSGTITSFKANFNANGHAYRCHNPYNGYLNGVHVGTYNPRCGWGLSEFNFGTGGLNIKVEANVPITISFTGTAAYGWSSSSYSLAIIADLKRKVANLESWLETNCNDS